MADQHVQQDEPKRKCQSVKQRSTRRHKRKKVFTGRRFNANSVHINQNDSDPVDKNVNIVNTATVDSVNMTPPRSKRNTVSARKVKPIEYSTPSAAGSVTGYRFMDMEILFNVVSLMACPEAECHSVGLVLTEKNEKRKGFASLLQIACKECCFTHEFYTSACTDKSFDINKRTIYTMRACGQGYGGVSMFSSLMNMPGCMASTSYDKVIKKFHAASKFVAEETMQEAAQDLHKTGESIVDIAVSCDGTWQRRGYSSNNGVVAVISMESGKVIDVESLSKLCRQCKLKEKLKAEKPDEYAEWRLSHICTYNYKGSSGGMEVEGAKRIWNRSIEKHNLRYTKFYGDGDSKAYDVVKETYQSTMVEKLECVGHVQKRVGTRLRSLKKREKGLGGRGKLTDATIDRLQNYYGIAIRQNKNDLAGMKKAVCATLFHVASSETNNFHFPHCPEGPDSWCRFNKDKEDGTKTYKPGPGLPVSIVCKLKPMYKELSSDKLLEKCLHGLTQNHNESFNKTIWDRLPKTNMVSITQLEFGVYDAVAVFNIGRKATILTFEKMGMHLSNSCRKINRKRLYQSSYKNSSPAKKQRKILRAKRKAKSDNISQTEGKSYKCGAF